MKDPHNIDRLCTVFAALALHPYVAWYRRWRKSLNDWLFGTTTRGIEALNAAMLLVWAVSVVDRDLLALPIYHGLSDLDHPWANHFLAVLFFAASGFAWMGVFRKQGQREKIAALGLQLGGLLWACVALNFFAAYPPFNTGVGAYGLLAIIAWLAGCHLLGE